MRVLKYLAVLTLGLTFLFIAHYDTASAADGVDLSTSPLPISLSAAPGTTVTTDIRIKNNSQTQTVKTSLMKFGAYGDTGKPALQDREPGDDYFDWVSFTPSTFVAPSGQWQTIKMTINVPKDAAFGYYYAAIFTPVSPKPEGKGNVLLGSTAVLVLLDVQNPNAKRSLQIVSFQADKHFYEFLPATFSLKLRNNGNVHLLPHGNIFITKGKKQVANILVNKGQGNILPGSNRVYTASWTDGFPVYAEKQQGGKVVLDEAGQPVTQLQWDWSKFSKLKFGRYNAHVVLVYDNGTRDVPLEANVGFWVIPTRVIIVPLFIILLAVFGLWSAGRNFAKKLIRRRSHGG